VKREPVALKREEDIWLRESGDFVHATRGTMAGYSIYRCAAANRGSPKQQMVADLLLFWGVESGDAEGVHKLEARSIYT
jgi:hypothetical protein